MKIVAITHKGFEDICSKEISELLSKKCVINGRFIECEISDIKDLFLLYYKAQSVEFIFLKLSEAKNIDDAIKNIDEKELKKWLDEDTHFVVECEREIVIDNVISIEKIVGEKVIEFTKAKVDFKKPEVKILVYVVEDCVCIGIDFAVIDLSKRQHKIYRTNNCLKGTLAYCLYRLANNPSIVVDPFCNSGEIVVEAALFESRRSVNFFQKDKLAFGSNPKFDDLKINDFFSNIDDMQKDCEVKLVAADSQLRLIKYVKSNSKIAGVEKFIDVARIDIEWIDTKFDEGTVSHIITQPPELSRGKDEKPLRKLLSEFFYQAEFILKSDGKIICINRDITMLKEEAVKEKFKIIDERKVWSGKQEYGVIVFENTVKE